MYLPGAMNLVVAKVGTMVCAEYGVLDVAEWLFSQEAEYPVTRHLRISNQFLILHSQAAPWVGLEERGMQVDHGTPIFETLTNVAPEFFLGGEHRIQPMTGGDEIQRRLLVHDIQRRDQVVEQAMSVIGPPALAAMG